MRSLILCGLLVLISITLSSISVASGSSFGKGKKIAKYAKYVSKLRFHAIQQGEPPHAIADPAIRSRLNVLDQYLETEEYKHLTVVNGSRR